MASKVETALEQEIAELRAILDTHPIAKKLKKLVAMLDIYRGVDEKVVDAVERDLATYVVAEAIGPRSTGRSRSPERQAVIDATVEFLRTRPVGIAGTVPPYTTSWIFKHLTDTGVTVPGTNPQNNLSAMLSNAREFVSHGRAGWTLAENENPADAETLTEQASTGLNDDLAGGLVEPPAQGGEARPGGGT